MGRFEERILYRVWTKNFGGNTSVLSDWDTKATCRRIILGRWGHWPPFAFISKCKTVESFRQYNGD
jgi:hypothetical protein